MLNPQAIQSVRQYLAQFAAKDDFEETIESIFGTEIDRVQLVKIHQQWLNGDLSTLPPIEIRPRVEINDAEGAFAVATGKIYLAQELLGNRTLEEVVSVLLEEYGHFVDAQLNAVDAPGDEGAIFSTLVREKSLSESVLQTIKKEDDTTIIILDNQAVELEMSANNPGSWKIERTGINLPPGQTISINSRDFNAGDNYAFIPAANITSPNGSSFIVYYEPFPFNGYTSTPTSRVSYDFSFQTIPSGVKVGPTLTNYDYGRNNPLSAGLKDIWTLQGSINLTLQGNGQYTEEVLKGEGAEQISFGNNPTADGTLKPYSNQGSFGLPIGSDPNYYTQSTRTDLNLNLSINNKNQVSPDLTSLLKTLWTPGKKTSGGRISSYIMQPHYGIVGGLTAQVGNFLSVDLELTKVDTPDPVKVGENLKYTLTVFNNSDNDATEVKLTDTLPQGVSFFSSSITSVKNNNILTFNLGTLAAKATKTVDVIVTPSQAGQITTTANVDSKEGDIDPNDNKIQQTTDVKEGSVYQFSSWKYLADGNGFKIVVDKTIYAGFLEGKNPTPNGIYKGGFKLDSLAPITVKDSKIETIKEDISNQFLNTNEILQAAKITQGIYNSDKTIGALFALTGLKLIGDISQASLAKLLGYNHFNWLQTVGSQISPDVDWYSGTRQDFENGSSKLVSNSGNILTNSGLLVDSLSGGNFIVSDLTSLGFTFNSYVSELGKRGWSINAVNVKSIDAISPTGNKYKVIDDLNGVYQIADTNQGLRADTKGFYIDIPGQGGNDTQYGGLLSSNGSILGFDDSPNLTTFDPNKGTQFTTYLVGVKNDLDFKNSQLLPISNSNFKWYSTVSGDSGTITGASLDIQADPSKLTGGIKIINNNVTSNELSREEKQFLAENGVNTIPSSVNLSVVRTINPGTVDIGQDYTYTLKVTNNGSDPATQVVLTEALPSGVDFISLTTTPPSLPSNTASVVADADGLITAKLGTLKDGESALVSITAKSKRSGTLYGATNVTSDEYDSNVTDNFLVSSQVINFVPIDTPIGVTRIGTPQADNLVGTNGNDTISGLAGNDTLYGDAGNDTIFGGMGVDLLFGGTGNDVFGFNNPSEGIDKINDFEVGIDLVGISRAGFGGASVFGSDSLVGGALDPSRFTLGTSATTASQRFIYNAQSGALFFDADGVGGATQVRVTQLVGNPNLTNASFVVI